MVFFLKEPKTKREGEEKKMQRLGFCDFFKERGSGFSLRSRAIGPSDFFGPRRKVVLRGEDYV